MKAKFLGLAMLAAGPAWLHAGMGDELAATHLERMGGLEKIRVIQAMRAEGKTFIGDKMVEVVMWAQRPNRLRVESRMEGKQFVQVYDGEHPPWQTHTIVDNGAPRLMGEGEAREFIRNADFDGPLIGYTEKGYTVDYAGEDQIEGRPAYKLLVMSRRDEIQFVWLDKENYLQIKRLEYRISQGMRLGIETYFKDFRPVKGVPQPFRIDTRAGGRVLNMIMIDKMEANPRLPRGVYDFPEALAEKKEKPVEKAAAERKPPATAGDETAAGKKQLSDVKAGESGTVSDGANEPGKPAGQSAEPKKTGFFRRLFGGEETAAPEAKSDPPVEGKGKDAAESAKPAESNPANQPADAKSTSKPAEEKQTEPKPKP